MNGWPPLPPSPEGASEPDEMVATYGRCSGIARAAFQAQDTEVFEEAMNTMDTIVAHAIAELIRARDSAP